MRASILLMFLLIWGQDLVGCIRLTAPAQIAVGAEALLGCQFDLGDEVLYSVKWYKDDREIYRYIPRNQPEQMWFKTPGVNVDLSRSSSDVLALINIQPESAGAYRCEVTGEAPRFTQAQDETYIDVHVLPKTGPRITGLKYEYQIGDRVSANCTSPGSRPGAMIKWLVNNKPLHRAFLRGPWRRASEDPPDTTETTLGMHFMVLPSHYKTGIMQIKCQVTIVPLYHKELAFVLNAPGDEEKDDEEEEEDPILDTAVPNIAVLEMTENYLPEEDPDGDVKPDIDTESPDVKIPTNTEATDNAKDCATLSAISLEAMAAGLLMHVMLLISIFNEHVLEDYL